MIRRLAGHADWARIVEIYNATIPSRTSTADTEPVTVEARGHWFREHTPDFRPLWVVEDCNRVVAWLSFSSFYGRPAYNRTAELSIYVDTAYQRRGIARELLRDAIVHSPTLGVDRLLAFIFAHNQPSLALFRSFRFEQWAYLPEVARLDGIDRDLVILGLKVS